MKLYIDDIRNPTNINEWIIARSVEQAKVAIQFYERNMNDNTILIDLDHDAGSFANDGGDYIEILNWLERIGIVDTGYFFHIHSMNPVGVQNMRCIINHNGWKEI